MLPTPSATSLRPAGRSRYRLGVVKRRKRAPERAFTIPALVLNVLLFEEGASVSELRAEIAEVTGAEVLHAALTAAGRTLLEDGCLVVEKIRRTDSGGPPVLRYRLTDKGRKTALELRDQAERYLFRPKYKSR